MSGRNIFWKIKLSNIYCQTFYNRWNDPHNVLFFTITFIHRWVFLPFPSYSHYVEIVFRAMMKLEVWNLLWKEQSLQRSAQVDYKVLRVIALKWDYLFLKTFWSTSVTVKKKIYLYIYLYTHIHVHHVLFLSIPGHCPVQCQPPQEGCPYEGLYHYPHETDCEKYYLCRNGTGTLEECPNGLLYQEHGAVYEFCAYYWKVDCPKGKTARE